MLPKRLVDKDRQYLFEHFKSLEERDLWMRFGYAASDSALKAYIDKLDFEQDALYGVFDLDLKLVALSHMAVMGHEKKVADFGVSVLSAYRCKGYGLELLQRSIEHAANIGVEKLMIQTLAQNKPMLTLILKNTSDIEVDGRERIGKLELENGTLLSKLHEFTVDEIAIAQFIVEKEVHHLNDMWRAVKDHKNVSQWLVSLREWTHERNPFKTS